MFEFPSDPVEIIAVVTGVISVFFSWRINILTYPFGLISVSLYIYLCFQAKIYADMGINVFYSFMSIYGWINWSKIKTIVVIKQSNVSNILLLPITAILWLILYLVLHNYTDSDIAIYDSFTTSLFITGMLLMAWKSIENWIYLLVGNLVSVPLYYYKGLYFTAILFVLLSIFAVLGFVNWKNKLNSNQK